MNEPVEGMEMAETKELVLDAYRTNCPRGTVAVPDKLSPRYELSPRYGTLPQHVLRKILLLWTCRLVWRAG